VFVATQQRTDAAASGTITLGDDLTVNRLGYGAMRITGPGRWGPPADRPEAVRVLRRAVELGVNFIDTADSYGPNVSEEIIAEALHPYPPGLVIATKGGFERSGPDLWTQNGRPDYLRGALEGSLRRLKLERIDLWQLHRIDKDVPEAEQFDVLAEFVREGKVRHVGLSEVGVDQIERARKVVPIVSVQNEYNLAKRDWESVVDYCTREHIAFIPWYPLRAGTLDRSPERKFKEIVKRAMGKSDASLDRAHQAITAVAQRRNATALQVALAWLLAHSPMMLVIPGTTKTTHVEENVAAATVKLDAADLALLDGTR
jgi:pyridoxine 4-dehydrogenase